VVDLIPEFQTPDEYLEFYFKKYNEHFKVQRFLDFPYRWVNYKTPEYEAFVKEHGVINHRERFADECIIDVDGDFEDGEKVELSEKQLAEIIVKRLDDEGYNYALYKSGGAGLHVQLLFPELLTYTVNDRKLLQRTFLKNIGKGHINKKDGRAHVCLHPGSLIQLERAKHRKGGVKKLLYIRNNSVVKNFFPDSLLEEFQREKQRLQETQKLPRIKGKPKEIEFLETEDFKSMRDGRDRALFILAAYYKQTMNDDELFTYLSEWNKYRLNGYFNSRTIRSKIKSTKGGFLKNYVRDLFEELGAVVI